MTSATNDEVTAEVVKSLQNTPFASSSLKQLSGGTANFIYRATLVAPLDDGTTEVLVKHSEDYIKDNPGFKLTLERCRVEEECLTKLADLAIAGETDPGDEFRYVVRTPKILYFDKGSNTQIQEYLAHGTDLKTYALETYPAHTPETFRPQCYQLGKALGRWLRQLHEGPSQQRQHIPQQQGLRLSGDKYKELQQLKHMVNFEWLQQRIAQFPTILGDSEAIFKAVKDMAFKELGESDTHAVIHGDFWTGNILLPNSPIQSGSDIPVFVVDWEMAQPGVPSLDLGQMIAELYELWLYKYIDAGLWIIQGIVEAYGSSEDLAFRTAIQVGVHLISFGTSVQGWGTAEQVEAVARTGRDLIVNAWGKRRDWFERGDLACLFTC